MVLRLNDLTLMLRQECNDYMIFFFKYRMSCIKREFLPTYLPIYIIGNFQGGIIRL